MARSLFSLAPLLLLLQAPPGPPLPPAESALRPAATLIREGKTAEAREFLNRYLKQHPEDAEAWHQLARTHLADFYEGGADPVKKRVSLSLALEALAHGKADGKLLRELLDAPEDDPDDLDALDRVWQEEAVTFGGNAGENACGPDRLRTRMRAASRDAATRPTEPPAA